MTAFGKELLQSAAEALSIAKGEAAPAQAYSFPAPDAAAIRKRLGLSQAAFARRYGLSPSTLRDWEQGRRAPDAPARALLRVIEYAPETVERALAEG